MIPSYRFGLAAVILVATPAMAQPSPQDAQAQIATVLSMVSGGMIGASDHPPQVTPDGDAWHVRVPLPALISPPDAAIDATAR